MTPNAVAATALVIGNGRVVCACSDADADALAGCTTRRVDLAGRVVLPGLIDAHNHLLMTGAVLNAVQLFDCRSIAAITERVAQRVRTTPPGTWVLGRGWDETLLDERRHPTRHDLDAVSPGHAVVLERV
jgi:predicted amidohydrolase YtcJ